MRNGGLHTMRTRQHRVRLKKGLAWVAVYFFERTGSAGLKVYWSGPGMAKKRRLLDGTAVMSTSACVNQGELTSHFRARLKNERGRKVSYVTS